MCIFARRMEVYLPLLHSLTYIIYINLKSASNLNGNLNCSKELEHYAS